MGGLPPPPMPPVDQDSDCHAVMVPSFMPAIFTFAKPDGRFPAIINSVGRSRKNLTGRPPLALERRAASRPQRSAENLLPNPPPMYCIWTCTFGAGILRLLDKSPPMPETFCVEG